jgi:hypothetical protein
MPQVDRWLVEFELEVGTDVDRVRAGLVALGVTVVPEYRPVPMAAGPGRAATVVLLVETADAPAEARVRAMAGLRGMVPDLSLRPAKET